MISIDDFKKLEIKIGEILSAEKVPETDKLLRLSVDFGLKPQSGSPDQNESSGLGEEDIRQIVSGISTYFPDPQVLVGKKCAFATNLEPRTIKGLQSQGMILAVSGESFFSLLETNSDVVSGSAVK
jgi:methionyl-tRNA synthetase